MQRKTFIRCLGAALGMAAVTPVLTGCGGGTAAEPDAAPVSGETTSPVTETVDEGVTAAGLSQAEIDGLLYMVEEEKLAHDVYVALDGLYSAQVPVFGKIALSETDHTGAVRQRILAHGLADPTAGQAAGVFVNAELQALYDALWANGKKGLIDALKVGCLIEEVDIQDLTERKADVDEDDILQVYDSLLCGSRNHLRAFNSALVKQGGSYAEEALLPNFVDIVSSANEQQCNRA